MVKVNRTDVKSIKTREDLIAALSEDDHNQTLIELIKAVPGADRSAKQVLSRIPAMLLGHSVIELLRGFSQEFWDARQRADSEYQAAMKTNADAFERHNLNSLKVNALIHTSFDGFELDYLIDDAKAQLACLRAHKNALLAEFED